MNKTLLSAALLCATVGTAQAASLQLLNVDAPGIGLNDERAAAPVGNNPGRSVGEQRRIAYKYAMDLWGGVLESGVDINVYASFAPLGCTATGGTLAQAGANWLFILDDGSPNGRVYPSALADSLLGFDVAPEVYGQDGIDDPGDIFSQFNGALGSTGCLEGSNWYYGLDGKTPAGTINFLNVVMHELGHGLGVAGYLNKTNGNYIGAGGTNPGWSDVYTFNAYDNVLNLPFESMTAAQRATAMRTPGRTVWTGASTNAQAALVLDNRKSFRLSAPAALAGQEWVYGTATYGPAPGATFGAGPFVVATDIVDPAIPGDTASNGCSPFTNAADVAGKIAVIDRGACAFVIKTANAQAAGARGVVFVNNVAGEFGDIGGDANSASIPSIILSQGDGATLKANIATVRASFVTSATKLAGADDAGRTRLYAPTVVAGGSTFSHLDTALSPNALMEPFDTPEIQSHVNIDLTPAVLADVGWPLNAGNAKIAKCDTGVDAQQAGGLIPGANLQAHDQMCAASSKGVRLNYQTCMNKQLDKLRAAGAISRIEYSSTVNCTFRRSF